MLALCLLIGALCVVVIWMANQILDAEAEELEEVGAMVDRFVNNETWHARQEWPFPPKWREVSRTEER